MLLSLKSLVNLNSIVSYVWKTRIISKIYKIIDCKKEWDSKRWEFSHCYNQNMINLKQKTIKSTQIETFFGMKVLIF